MTGDAAGRIADLLSAAALSRCRYSLQPDLDRHGLLGNVADLGLVDREPLELPVHLGLEVQGHPHGGFPGGFRPDRTAILRTSSDRGHIGGPHFPPSGQAATMRSASKQIDLGGSDAP